MNYYNRVTLELKILDNGAGYTYTSNVVRQARGSPGGNQINFVTGVAEDSFFVCLPGTNQLQSAAVAGAYGYAGFGFDLTTSLDANTLCFAPTAAVSSLMVSASRIYGPVIGSHFVSMNESSDNVHATTFSANSKAEMIMQMKG